MYNALLDTYCYYQDTALSLCIPIFKSFFFKPEEENIAIEKVHLNADTASERFRGKYLDGSKADFSDRITKPRKQRGYDAQTLWELAPAGEPETTFQKYLRLKVCYVI